MGSEMCIRDSNKDKALSKDEIIKNIEEVFAFKNIPLFIIENALTRLQTEGCIDNECVDEEELYMLTNKGVDKVRSALSKRLNVEDKAVSIFMKILERHLNHRLSDFEIEIAKRCLYEFLSRVFNQWSIVSSRLLTLEYINLDIPHYDVIIKDVISGVRSPLKDAIKYAIEDFLKEASKNDVVAKFIASISQSYFIIQLLNLDPELKKIQKESLMNITVYVDTNVIIPPFM